MLKDLDHIYVLSLKTSIQRQTKFKENFPELIKLDIFEWFLVDKDSENTERGCYISHQKILKLAKEKKYKTILIIEDDVRPLVSWSVFVNEFNKLKRPKNWKTIQFGYIPLKTTRTSDKNLYAMNCGYFAEAYLVNVSLVEIPDYNGSQIDCFLFCNNYSHLDIMLRPELTDKINKDTFAHKPRLFQQIFKDSDIGHDNGIIVFFYNFYGYIYDITELSSFINLLLLSFLIVFGLFSLLLIPIVSKFLKIYANYINKLLSIVIILITLTILVICYLNSNEMIMIKY